MSTMQKAVNKVSYKAGKLVVNTTYTAEVLKLNQMMLNIKNNVLVSSTNVNSCKFNSK